MDGAVHGYAQDCRALADLDLDIDACVDMWDAALALALAGANGAASRWLHGDLLAENLLVRDGRLGAVIDFGGLAIGDPTVDLVVAWEVLDCHGRQVFRSALGVDELGWQRGKAWAMAIVLMTFPYYWRTMPARCSARLVMARAVLDD